MDQSIKHEGWGGDIKPEFIWPMEIAPGGGGSLAEPLNDMITLA